MTGETDLECMEKPELDTSTNLEGGISSDIGRSAIPSGMTLESIIDLTGEMEHLNELILLHLDKNGGFTCEAAYFSTVRPVLDLLEAEIRFRYVPGMNKNDMKLFISRWIDEEISLLQ